MLLLNHENRTDQFKKRNNRENLGKDKTSSIFHVMVEGMKLKLGKQIAQIALFLMVVVSVFVLNRIPSYAAKQNVLMEMEYYSAFNMDASYRSSVANIIFLNTLADMPSNAWDVSENNDGSVMAWTVMNEQGCCDMYVAGEGGVWANPDSAWLFQNFNNVVSINFNNCFHIENVIEMDAMFDGCSSLETLDIGDWDFSKVTDMDFMFNDCSSLKTLDVSSWDTSNVTDMMSLFEDCSSLEALDVSDWDTSNVTDMSFMFNGCSSLKNIDVSKWDTGNVTKIGLMFANCSDLKSLDVNGWNTSNMTYMLAVFMDCNGLEELDLSGWDTSSVTDMGSMFLECFSLKRLDANGWDTSNVTDMSYLFGGCAALQALDISGWDMTNANTLGMFDGTIWG